MPSSIASTGRGFRKIRRCLSHGWTPEPGFIPSRWDSIQRADDDVSARNGIHRRIRSTAMRGLRGSGRFSSTTGCATSARLLRFSSTSIRRHGSIFAASATAMRTTFKNSIIATDVHRRFCLELNAQFSDYSNALWGITASDSATGLRGLGRSAGDGTDRRHDRTGGGRRLVAISAQRDHAGACERFTITIRRPGAGTDLWMHSTH